MHPSIPSSDQIASMTIEQLRSELARLHGLSVEILEAQAAICKRLIDAGVDIYDLGVNRPNWLIGIAEGRLIPKVVCKFIGRPNVINKIMTLPIKEQENLADGGTVEVAVHDGRGGFTKANMPVCDMGSKEVIQVLQPGRIVGVAEQQSRLRTRIAAVKELSVKVKKIGNLKMDYENDGVVTLVSKNGFVSSSDLRAALKALDAART